MKKRVAIVVVTILCTLLGVAGYVSYRRVFDSESTGLAAELKKFDETLRPAIERRQKIRDLLSKQQRQERDVCAKLVDATCRLSQEDRAALEDDFKAGVLSEQNAKRLDLTVAFTQYEEALALKRDVAALDERLQMYERAIVRALAERESLQRRLELSETLGYDPESADSDPASGNELLDNLIAQTDDAIGSATETTKLTPEDVVKLPVQEREDFVHEIAALNALDVSNETENISDGYESANDETTQKLDEYSARYEATHDVVANCLFMGLFSLGLLVNFSPKTSSFESFFICLGMLIIPGTVMFIHGLTTYVDSPGWAVGYVVLAVMIFMTCIRVFRRSL